jgi:hypothetical protein
MLYMSRPSSGINTLQKQVVKLHYMVPMQIIVLTEPRDENRRNVYCKGELNI